MKALNYKLITLIFIAITSFATAQDSYEKKFHEEYEISKETTFEISNSFGDIKIENSNDDKITIDAEIIVNTKSQSKADKIMSSITITISQSGNIVKAITNIDDLKTNNSSFEINYKVTMPAYVNTNLKNKYGNVTINELSGKSNISVKYGSLSVNKILDSNEKPLSTVELGYCSKSRINEFNWGKIIIKYSKLEVGKGKALVISSKYSKLKLGNFSSIVAEGGYDDYEINSVTNFIIDAKYTDIEIEQLNKKLSVENKYGRISVDKISNDFESINVESKYGNINLGLSENASYKLYAKTKYADIKYNDLKITKRIKESSSIEINGYSGSESANAKVKIISEYGDIDLRE